MAEAARAEAAMAEAVRAEARTARAARAAVRQAAEAAVEAAVEAAAEARKQAAQSAADAAAAREQAARSAAEAAAAGKKARGCKKAEQAARGASSGGARSDDVAARRASTPPARCPPVASRRAVTQQRCRSGHPLLAPRPPLAALQPPPSPSLAVLHPASLQQAASLVGLASAAARAACDRYRPACCEPSAVALPVAAAIAHSGPDLSRRSLAEIDLSDFEHRSLRDSVTGDLRPSVRHRLRAQSREGESCIV